MALNPSIILAGQQFDLAGSMGAGNQLAAQTNQLRDQNALRDVYRTQGAGILQGNQGSLNALAAVDPAQAMQMQAGQLDMQATQQRMDMLSREEQRQLAAAKASMTAAEAAAAAAQIEDAVKMGLAIQDPAQWDAVMAQQAPDLVGQFNNRQALAMKYMSMAEVLKANAPPEAPKPQSPQAKFEADKAAGLLPPDAVYKGDAPSVTINNPGDDKFSEAFAKEDATLLGQISAAGIAAQRNIGRIDQLGTLLEETPTGAGAAAKRWLGERGIATEGLSEIQAVQAAINSLVPEQRQPGSGPMSDADLALFKESLPRLINQPGGNEIIVGTMRAIAQYDAEGAVIAQRLRSGEITRAQAFDALQNRKNPLDDFKVGAGQPQATPTTAPPPVAPSGNAGGVQWRIVE